MTTFVYVLAGLALATAVFLIANTMNTLMAEQTAEIGVMKAIGGRRRQIAGVFLRAALYLAAFGVAIGVPLGALLASTIASYITSSVLGVPGRFDVSIPVIIFSAGFAVALTVAATLPALRRGLRIPVSESLRSQGGGVTFGVSRSTGCSCTTGCCPALSDSVPATSCATSDGRPRRPCRWHLQSPPLWDSSTWRSRSPGPSTPTTRSSSGMRACTRRPAPRRWTPRPAGLPPPPLASSASSRSCRTPSNTPERHTVFSE